MIYRSESKLPVVVWSFQKQFAPMSNTLVLCQFKLSLEFIIANCALEFLPAENVKFHNFTLIPIHINIDSNQDRRIVRLILPNFSESL